MKLNLQAHQPFNFHSVVYSHGWAQLAPFQADRENGLLTYILRLDSGRVLELQMAETDGGIRVITGEMSTSEQEQVREVVSWMMAIDQDFSDFYVAARGEPKLAGVEEKAQGRVLRSPTLFEDVVKTILTTNTQWAATRRMTANLVKQFGESMGDHSEQRAFPTPEQLAGSTPEILKEETRLGYRAPYIHELSQRVASGDLDLEKLKTSDIPTTDLRKQLLAIKGVGNYAAANLLMILGRFDFIPIDSWAMKMVSHEWHDGNPVDPAEVEAAFEKWGQWKGLAYWFWDWKYKG